MQYGFVQSMGRYGMSLATGLSLQELPIVEPPDVPPRAVLLDKFKIHRQERDRWCWVAVTASISEFYEKVSFKQCAVAKRTLIKNQAVVNNAAIGECCPKETHQPCNVAFSTDLALEAMKHLAKSSPGHLEFADIIVEIPEIAPPLPAPRGRPIGCSVIGMEEPGAHAMVISGWQERTDGQRYIYVNNPIGPTSSFRSYDEFVDGPEISWD